MTTYLSLLGSLQMQFWGFTTLALKTRGVGSKNLLFAVCWWLTPVILATQEAEIR
jgi:hypothetical protein